MYKGKNKTIYIYVCTYLKTVKHIGFYIIHRKEFRLSHLIYKIQFKFPFSTLTDSCTITH
jgi:hypothetical protein